MNPSVLDFRGVSFDYKSAALEFRALHSIDLRIEQGDFVAILGASGSGKSTLMNIMGLMASPTEGEFEFAGINVSAMNDDGFARERNQHIGFVFQQFFLLPRLTALENVRLPFVYQGSNNPLSEELALDALDRVGLLEFANRHPSLLSGGQKQRVAIARALVHSPTLLLADEPTGALDSKTGESVMGLFKELNREGKTIVLITHDLKVAAHAKRIVELKDGRIVRDETTTQPEAQSEEPKAGVSKDDNAVGQSSPFQSRPLRLFQGVRSEASDVSMSRTHVRRETAKRRKNSVAGLAVSFFHFFLSIWVAFKSLLGQLALTPVRSSLTLLGLGIGVCSVVIMLSLTSELKVVFRKFFDTQGGRNGYIMYDWRTAERLGAPRWQGLHRETELPFLNSAFSKYGRIDAQSEESGCRARSAYGTSSSVVNGIDSFPQFQESGMVLKQGRFFNPAELALDNNAKVTILGADAAENLFPKKYGLQKENYPLGEMVTISGDCSLNTSARVVGVLEDLDSTFDRSINSSLWLPTPSLLKGGLGKLSRSLTVVPFESTNPLWFAESVRGYLRSKTQDRFPLRVSVPEQQISKINLMLNILGGLTLVIGALCTLIGGIGVMNIMLINIAERVREIGIRRALGARQKHIRNQFLAESILLCLLGGLLGTTVGILVSNLANVVGRSFFPRLLEDQFLVNSTAILVALSSSVLCGVVFGMMPANRAAKMDVVESLRQE